jgi:hypothetical protein
MNEHPILFSGPMVRAILGCGLSRFRSPMINPGAIIRHIVARVRCLFGHKWDYHGYDTVICVRCGKIDIKFSR